MINPKVTQLVSVFIVLGGVRLLLCKKCFRKGLTANWPDIGRYLLGLTGVVMGLFMVVRPSLYEDTLLYPALFILALFFYFWLRRKKSEEKKLE